MRCHACGRENPPQNRFCEGCGATAAITCAACGHAASPAALFCGRCGAMLLATGGSGGQPARDGTATGARGELKQVTVLFADLVSSTELVARLDPEEAMRRLKPALAAMRGSVEEFQGIVVQSLGDGIMALFGAPRAQEGHALLACRAALSIRDAFADPAGGLAVRIGLHSGEAVAESFWDDPSDHRARAYGLTLHLGSRLPAQVEPGAICLSEDTERLVNAFCDVSPLGSTVLRGVPKPVRLFVLNGFRPDLATPRFHAAELTAFRGREAEMALLQQRVLALEAGAGRVIGIVGEPGTGKSRLCFEFARWCHERRIPVWEVRAQPYGVASPLQPILAFVRSSLFGVAPSDDPAEATLRIAACLLDCSPEHRGDLPLLCEFLGVPHDEKPPSWINPRARNARLLEVLRDIIRRRGVEKSVLLIEDLHWFDEVSQEVVAILVEALAATPTMMVTNFRPGYAASWMQLPHHEGMELAELDPGATGALVDELIGPRPELQKIRRLVAARSGGNPFFAEELVRSLADQAILSGERGRYRRGTAAGASVLPGTVQAVVGARIDMLPAAEREILQIGAIIGKEFERPVLLSVAGQPAGKVDRALDHLCRVGLVNSIAGQDGIAYGFRHPLIQEVAYSTQLRTRRGALHGAVARAIEHFHADRLDDFAALLAHHLEETGDRRGAARYAARAARRAASTSPAQATRHWRKVRMLMAAEPRSRENDELRIEASSRIAQLGWREGLTVAEASPLVQEALVWAREIDDSIVPLLLFVDARMAQVNGGKADDYVASIRQAIAAAKPQRDIGRIATLHAALSHGYGWAGLLREALAASDAALACMSSVTDSDHEFLGYNVEHWTISLRGRLLVRRGEFEAARACFDHMIGIKGWIDPTVQFVAHFGWVDLAWCLADAALAAEHAAHVAAIAARHDSPYMRLYSLACQGMAQAIARDHAGAIGTLTRALDFLRETGVATEVEPEILANLADCLDRDGQTRRAIDVARAALASAVERSGRLPECRASIILARALITGAHDGDEAASLLARAERLIAVTGARIYERLLDDARQIAGDRGQAVAAPDEQRELSHSVSADDLH